MEHKTSAHYQRLHRQRLREQGLVKKEVWILPEHSPLLQRLEKQMRLPQALPDSLLIDHKEGSMDSANHAYSSIHSLADDLQQARWRAMAGCMSRCLRAPMPACW